MGLREINAARTERLIVDTAMRLFFTEGYDATTMEDIAAAAGVSTSTLYRYFGTKEAVVIGFLGDPALMADELSARPADEPIDVALGHAVIAFVSFVTADRQEAEKFGDLLSANARPRARLAEWLNGVQAALIEAIAQRTGASGDDVHVAAAAWMAIFVIQHSAGLSGRHADAGDSTMLAQQVMRELAGHPVITPQTRA